jgi:hypothetical protein
VLRVVWRLCTAADARWPEPRANSKGLQVVVATHTSVHCPSRSASTSARDTPIDLPRLTVRPMSTSRSPAAGAMLCTSKPVVEAIQPVGSMQAAALTPAWSASTPTIPPCTTRASKVRSGRTGSSMRDTPAGSKPATRRPSSREAGMASIAAFRSGRWPASTSGGAVQAFSGMGRLRQSDAQTICKPRPDPR